MPPKLRLPHLSISSPRTAVTSLPRNSFTATDYYRETREEIYSPTSRAESFSNAYAESAQRSSHLSHIHGSSKPASKDSEDPDEPWMGKRPALFWHIFTLLFGKWRRQKPNDARSKVRRHP
ncbi:hypothetical protein B0H10DRAFT_1938018 [Mycena sp. CBHHK59/15]|nr:hypothetical protein B0H10DRAFT_1938018 [Mycena sp. CBHHK59/15]